jgi:hypothetical protein
MMEPVIAAPHSVLYEINTRVDLHARSAAFGRPAILDDIPDAELDRLAALGFEWIWLLGVWETGPLSRQAALVDSGLLAEYRRLLPDFDESDVCGSCFAVASYRVDPALGGEAALRRFRERLNTRGCRLMLDFVPNHTALDHPWAMEHPDFYVRGSEADLARAPKNYIRLTRNGGGEAIFAHGRDPNFAGWQDTLQLDYGNPRLREAMAAELLAIAGRCDGVRCDMAMLLRPDVFERTWGIRPSPFWPDAIDRVRREQPDFFFLAEVYWDLEWDLQQDGFDGTYDKRLYDRLRDQTARPVRDHLRAGLDFQRRSARFLENHDERRAAASFPPDVHRAAAILSFLTPGLRFFHQGQFEGRRDRIPVQLRRGPDEPPDEELRAFYGGLLERVRDPIIRNGAWTLLDPIEAWPGNWTWDGFVAFAWEERQGDGPGRRLLVAVNYQPNQGQCYVPIRFAGLAGATWRLADLMSSASYDRDGDALLSPGLYLDTPAWAYHVFEVTRAP